MGEILVTTETELLEVEVVQQELVELDPGAHELLEVGIQGPPGPPGPPGGPGPVGDANGAFRVTNRFNEIAEDEIAKVQARLNLGVQNIDGGTFN